MNLIRAYWFLSNNFGDALTPYILEKLTRKICVFEPPMSDNKKLIVTGSILSVEARNAIVWGAGLSEDITINNFADKTIVAVRGHRTLENLQKSGYDGNPFIGDPALLLPRLFTPPQQNKRYALGIVPHYSEMDCVSPERNMNYISPLWHIERVITEMHQCEKIITSSLHALITAHAYGIPAELVFFGNHLLKNTFKYEDYYTTVDPPFEMEFLRNVNLRYFIDKQLPLPTYRYSINDFLKTFPQ